MSSETIADFRPLLRKLDRSRPLTEDERRSVFELPMHIRELAAGQDLVREGDRPSQCCLLLDGFAQRYKVLGNGRRQIMSFHIPGDLPDLLSLHLAVMDHSLGTLAPSRVGFIPHKSLRRMLHTHPRLVDVLWRDTLIDGAMFREWMVGMGRRDARSRVAHLVCEIITRMEVVGLADGKSVRVPLTQGTIGDALGLSTVHVNRVTQELRSDGLLTWRGKTLAVRDWERLKEVAEFDPGYLHLHQDEPV